MHRQDRRGWRGARHGLVLRQRRVQHPERGLCPQGRGRIRGQKRGRLRGKGSAHRGGRGPVRPRDGQPGQPGQPGQRGQRGVRRGGAVRPRARAHPRAPGGLREQVQHSRARGQDDPVETGGARHGRFYNNQHFCNKTVFPLPLTATGITQPCTRTSLCLNPLPEKTRPL